MITLNSHGSFEQHCFVFELTVVESAPAEPQVIPPRVEICQTSSLQRFPALRASLAQAAQSWNEIEFAYGLAHCHLQTTQIFRLPFIDVPCHHDPDIQ